MIPRDQLSGLVLAGGRARRLQQAGQAQVDKGSIELRGEPLVAHAGRFLAPQVAHVWISANQHADFYARYGSVVGDDPAYGPSSGPLAGVASVLAVMTTPWLAVVPVDVPDLPGDLLPRLAAAALAAPGRIAYAQTDRQVHPLCMIAHRDALAGLHAGLLRGERKVRQWQQMGGARAVRFDAGGASFFNINTREDLCQAQRRVFSESP